MRNYKFIINKAQLCILKASFVYLFVTSSCSSSQNLRTNTTKDYIEDLKVMRIQMDSLSQNITVNQHEIFKLISNLRIDNKSILFYPPDSTGKQYPMKETTTIVNKEYLNDGSIDTSIDSETHQISVGLEELKDLMKSIVDNTTEKVQLSWWSLNKDKIFIVFLVIVGVLIYRLFKK